MPSALGRVYRYLLLCSALVSLGLVGCQRFAQETPPPNSTEESAPAEASPQASAASVDRIVYVGNDFQIYTVNSDGTDRQLVTGNIRFSGLDPSSPEPETALFSWPSWSPDNSRVLFSAVFSGEPFARAALLTADAQGGRSTMLFTNPPGPLSMVAQDSPYYALWSPDGKHVAFLVGGDEDGLALYLAPSQGEREAQVITTGSPLYLAWSQDAQSLLLHRQSNILRVDLDAPGTAFPMGPPSIDYRAPSWSPTSDAMAFLITDDGGNGALYTARFDGSRRTALATTRGFASFLWAPQGERIAIGHSLDPADRTLHEVQVVDVDTKESVTLAAQEEPVLAFFWSPDGSMIALVTPNASRDSLQWQVVDSHTGATKKVVEFNPSSDLLTVLVYFDQYTQSHQVWSPDSRYLLFTGTIPEPGSNAGTGQRASQVFVVEVEGNRPPIPIDEGHLASWSSQ